MIYEQHPLDKAYPPLTAAESGPPAILFDGKILHGYTYYRACLEKGVEPKIETPPIAEPEEFITFARYEIALKESALPTYKGHKKTAERLGEIIRGQRIGISSSGIYRRIEIAKQGIPEVEEAYKAGKLTLGGGWVISHSPKETQATKLAEALEKGVISRTPSSVKRKASEARKAVDMRTPEEIEKEKECLAIITAASTFPFSAKIPTANDLETQGLRTAIEWLRKHEGEIQNFKDAQLYQMLLRTNRIQAYKTNWGKHPRPEGELDRRILDWASDLWRRQQRQHDRLAIATKLRARRRSTRREVRGRPAITEGGGGKPFEDRYRAWFSQVADVTARLFAPKEHVKLLRAFKTDLVKLSPGEEDQPRGNGDR